MEQIVSIESVKSEFKVSQSNIDAMSLNCDGDTIFEYFKVLRVLNNGWNYINPELVQDTNSIVLCPKCFENNLEHPFSVSRGHGYGIILSLSELSKPSQNNISLMILFG